MTVPGHRAAKWLPSSRFTPNAPLHTSENGQKSRCPQVRAYLRGRADELTVWAEGKATNLEQTEADKLRRWAKYQAQTIRSKNTVAAVESLARSNAASVAGADAFDADLLLLGTPGGTVDLRTGELRRAERGDMITKMTACAPAAPGSRPERWLTFLHEIFDGDGDLVDLMERAAGYALWRAITETEPQGWFDTAARQSLLRLYVEHLDFRAKLQGLIDRAPIEKMLDPDTEAGFERMLRARDRETKTLVSPATRLRLTNQSRYTPAAAGTAGRNNATGPKPWEDDAAARQYFD